MADSKIGRIAIWSITGSPTSKLPCVYRPKSPVFTRTMLPAQLSSISGKASSNSKVKLLTVKFNRKACDCLLVGLECMHAQADDPDVTHLDLCQLFF